MDRVAVVSVVLRRRRGDMDVCRFDGDRSCSDRCACSLAKESGDWIQNCRRVASCSVYGLVSLPSLKDIFDVGF